MPFTRTRAAPIAVVIAACAMGLVPADSTAEPKRPVPYASLQAAGARMQRALAEAHGPRPRPTSATLAWGAFAHRPAPPGTPPPGAVVVAGAIRVIDGDTFAIGRRRFRLRGVDTPERGDPRWLLAARRLDVLLRTGPLTVVRHGEDVYGRTLVDVYAGTRDVAAMLRSDGFDTRVHRRRR